MNVPGFSAEASLPVSNAGYRTAAARIAGSRGVSPQLRDIWTTSNVCEACGCTVSGFQCNCGLRPDPRKVDCIVNGGPKKVAVFDAGSFGSTISRSRLP